MRPLSAAMLCLLAALAHASPAAAEAPEPRLSVHLQETVITQAHPAFSAAYSGPNSLAPAAESATSITSTLFLAARPWSGGELHLDPELSGGSGVSGARGIAGFSNGETFRIGSTTPVIYLARLFVRQTIPLGARGGDDDGVARPAALALSLGRLGVADLLDNNHFSHDPRTQFLNWALMNSAAWDYPADTRGYTWGLLADASAGRWSWRAAATLVPREANGLAMDTRIGKAHGLTVEGERRYRVACLGGAVRLLVYRNDARMGQYDEAVAMGAAAGTTPDVTATRRDGRTKIGFALGAEQAIHHGGLFARVSANDGQNETWAYTEVERSLAAGAVQDGARWRRPHDEVAVAGVLDGLAAPHRRYLAAGGSGFMLGDGALRYGLEAIVESYYRAAITAALSVSIDYQLVVDPGYNRDRGPVHLFAARLHAEL